MNRYAFIGHLGKDADVRTIESGATVIAFTVAVTETWKDKQGNKQEKTTWVNCSIWRQPGSSIAIGQYLRKGTKVLVEGKPEARAYQKNDGTAGASLEVRVDNLELLSSLQQQQGQPQQAAPQQRGVSQEQIRQQNAGYVAPQQFSQPAQAAYDRQQQTYHPVDTGSIADDLPF